MRRLALLLLLLVLGLPASAAGPSLQELLDRSAPLIEAELGATFAQRPTLREATREELAAVLAAEFLPQVRVQLPNGPEEEVQRAVASTSDLYSRILIGKYDAAAHAIYLVPENRPREDLLRATVLHELVHALDEQEVGAFSGIAGLQTRAELEIWNALVEGHAQYVTRRVLAAAGEEAAFEAFEDHITRTPPGMPEGDRYLFGLLSHSFRFAYVDGRRFFEGLPREHHREVFLSPPTSKSEILHPEQYLGKPAGVQTLDVTPLWTALAAALPAEWRGGQRVGDEAMLRAAFGEMLDPSRVEPVVARIRASHFLHARAPDNGALAAYATYELESVEAAAAFLALQEALSRAKDEKMKEGAVRVLSATYSPLTVPGATSAFLVEKQVDAAGQQLVVRSAIGSAGAFVLEVIHSGAVAGDPAADLARMAQFVGPR